jgi:hypothetical protein
MVSTDPNVSQPMPYPKRKRGRPKSAQNPHAYNFEEALSQFYGILKRYELKRENRAKHTREELKASWKVLQSPEAIPARRQLGEAMYRNGYQDATRNARLAFLAYASMTFNPGIKRTKVQLAREARGILRSQEATEEQKQDARRQLQMLGDSARKALKPKPVVTQEQMKKFLEAVMECGRSLPLLKPISLKCNIRQPVLRKMLQRKRGWTVKGRRYYWGGDGEREWIVIGEAAASVNN